MKHVQMCAALAFLVGVSLAIQAPKRIYIDPDSKWESVHDAKGAEAPNEMAKELLRSCPSLTVTRDSGAGTAVIYRGKDAAFTFKPGFNKRLKDIASKTCSWISRDAK